MPTLISHKHRFVFVHVPKTGGTSLASALLEEFPDMHVFPGHHRLVNMRHAGHLPKHGDYFSFCVVRNPYDRVRSLYGHFMSDDIHGSFDAVDLLPPREREIRRLTKELGSFSGFCQHLSTFSDYPLFRDQCFWITGNTWLMEKFNGVAKRLRLGVRFSEQRLSNGILQVVYLLRYESLKDDVGALAEKLGCRSLRLPHHRQSHSGRLDGAVNLDSKSIEAIRRAYASDFIKLGYDIE